MEKNEIKSRKKGYTLIFVFPSSPFQGEAMSKNY